MVSCAVVVVLLSGCADGNEEVTAPTTDAFDALVAEADSALQSGNAQAAFDLYSEAFTLSATNDPDGTIAARQEQAKHLYIARNMLAKDSTYDLKTFVAIMVEHSTAETETAEAKRRMVQFFQDEHDVMVRDLGKLRTTIRAEEPYKLPASIYMAEGMEPNYRKDMSRLEGQFGTEMIQALDYLVLAADQASECMNHEWISEAEAELDIAEETLLKLQEHLDSVVE